MKLVRLAVFLMMFLVLMLPFCYAKSLEITSFAGRDNVQRYARSDDTVTMNIKAMIPRDLAISESQVEVCKGRLCENPASCASGESYGKDIFNDCVYTESFEDEKGLFQYSVKLSDDDNEVVKIVSTTLGIDKVPPSINRFDINPRATKDSVKIEVDAQDFGSEKGNANYCTGIEKIEFYNKDTGEVLTARTYGYEKCDIKDRFDYAHTSDEKSESFDLCARAVDLFGQESEPVCVRFVYDNEGPVFKSFGLADKDGNPVSHITSAGGVFDLVLNMEDVSEVKRVSADLSKITGDSADKNKKFDYRKDNQFYWSDYRITPDTVCEAVIKATDALDNSAEGPVACSVLVDDKGPEVEAITTSYVDFAGSDVVAPHTQIKAKILEEGVGLYRKNIFLDLKEIGGDIIPPDSCEKISDTVWMCYWNDITPQVRDGDYQIRITEASKDDLGNSLFRKASLEIEVYNKAPQISTISQYPIGPTTEDTIEFTLRVVNAKAEPSVFVDASRISTDAFPKEASCVSAGIEEWECYVDVGMLQNMYMKERIVFYTQSGESAKQEVPFEITVYEPEPVGGVDFYTITGVKVIPQKGFDRRLVYNIPAPVYLQPRLKKKNPRLDISIIEKSVECNAEGASEVYLASQTTDSPYVVVKSSPAIAERETPLPVNCTLSLIVRQGKKIYKNPEVETFSAMIPVYNNPLGTVNENAQEQITAINDRIWDLQKRTNRWSDVNDWLATIVTIAQTVAQLDVVANYIGGALWLISVVFYELKAIPIVGPALNALQKLLWKGIGCEMINNAIHKMILRYIWNPGMVGTEIFSADFSVGAGRLIATLIKTVSIIYSCQLCDFGSSFYSGTKKVISGDVSMDVEGSRGEPTTLETFTVHDWDPYRSIHVAMGCMCMPGIVYNMRKEVQVNCIYRNCIEQNAELGLPFDNCQQMFKEQNCLYVDGAAWRISGGSGIAFTFSTLLTVILEQLPIMIGSKAWSKICDPDCGYLAEQEKSGKKTDDCGKYSLSFKGGENTAYPDKCSQNPEEDWEVPLCGVWAGTMILQEIDYFGTNKYEWDRFTAELKGEDFCD